MLNGTPKIIKHKAGLLNLAEELGNVSRSCRIETFEEHLFLFKPRRRPLAGLIGKKRRGFMIMFAKRQSGLPDAGRQPFVAGKDYGLSALPNALCRHGDADLRPILIGKGQLKFHKRPRDAVFGRHRPMNMSAKNQARILGIGMYY